MGYVFRDWLACPDCHERAELSVLAHRTDMVLECYACGLISEFTIGEDISLQNLDVDAITEILEEQQSD